LSNEYLLGIDVGTTGTKSVIFDSNGNLVSKGYVEYPVNVPKPGWAEQNPTTWWDATVESLKTALSKAAVSPDRILCIGLSGQTNSPSFIDERGNPLRPSILWLDRRAEPQASRLREAMGEERIYKVIGVKIDAFYSYCKVLWVKENQPDVLEETKTIMQPKDYIGYKLTGERVLDKALASSSGFLDTRRGEYAMDLLEEIGFPTEKLPRLVLSHEIIGDVTAKASELTGLTKDTPIVAGSGDVIVNAVGSGTVKSGYAYNKTATASDIVVCIDQPMFDPKIRMVSYVHAVPDKWLLVGGAAGGVCYRWFRDKFAQVESVVAKNLGKDSYEVMDAEAQQVEPGSANLIFLPYMMGARSPVWDPNARGVYFGIGINHDKRHFTRAIMEGIAYSVRHRIDILEKELGVMIKEVRVVGGGARSPLWRRIMSDVYNKPVILLSGEEQECLGSAMLAGVGAGLFKDSVGACERMTSTVERLEPVKENSEKYERLLKVYVSLYDRLKDSFDALARS